MAKTTPGRGIRIPLSEKSWRIILRELERLPSVTSEPSEAQKAASLRSYIERKLGESLQQR